MTNYYCYNCTQSYPLSEIPNFICKKCHNSFFMKESVDFIEYNLD